jgi:hypothetical protein
LLGYFYSHYDSNGYGGDAPPVCGDVSHDDGSDFIYVSEICLLEHLNFRHLPIILKQLVHLFSC